MIKLNSWSMHYAELIYKDKAQPLNSKIKERKIPLP